jgi:hypothetical protein
MRRRARRWARRRLGCGRGKPTPASAAAHQHDGAAAADHDQRAAPHDQLSDARDDVGSAAGHAYDPRGDDAPREAPPPPATSATSVGTLTNTAQTGPAKTLAAATSSSTGVPRIAVFASIAAGSLVLLAFIALGVSILVSRGRPERKAGGGNILIR